MNAGFYGPPGIAGSQGQNRLTSFRFSPNNALLATAGRDDMRVRLWDTVTGREQLVLAHEGPLSSSMAFSDDSKRLATLNLGFPGMARVWDLSSKHELVRIKLGGRLGAMAFSPDGTRLATSGKNSAKVWDVATKEKLAQFELKDAIVRMIFTPDSQMLATGSFGNVVRLWDINTGKEQRRFYHNARVSFMDFIPGSKNLITYGPDHVARAWNTEAGEERFQIAHKDEGTVEHIAYSSRSSHVATAKQGLTQVWDSDTGQKIAQFSLIKGDAELLTLSGDGKRLATVTNPHLFRSKTVQLWDITTEQKLFQLNHDKPVNSVTFSPDDSRIATGSDDQTARVWNAGTGKELFRFSHSEKVFGTTVSPNGTYLAVKTGGTGGQGVHVWHLISKQKVAWLPPYGSGIDEVVFSPDGRFLATADGTPTVRLWDFTSAQAELVRIPIGGWATSVDLSSDGKRVAATIDDDITASTAKIWDITTGKELLAMSHPKRVYQIAFSPDGNHIVTTSSDNTVRLRDIINGRELAQFNHEFRVSGDGMTWSPNGSHVAVETFAVTGRILSGLAPLSGPVLLWNVTSRSVIQVAKDGHTNAVAFSPDGSRLATAEGGSKFALGDRGFPHETEVGLLAVRIWDVATGQELVRLLHKHQVYQVLFSPNGDLIATDMPLTRTDAVQLWNSTTGQRIARLMASTDGEAIELEAFSPNGKYLATRSYQEVLIWDVAAQQELVRLVHNESVSYAIFSSDNRQVAVANGSKVSVWDWSKGKELVQLHHEDSVTSIDFTLDDSRIVTASEDKTIRVWAWRSNDLIADACLRLERNLTREERRTYLRDETDEDESACPDLPVPEK